MSEHGPDFVSSALNIPKYRFMMILLSAVSLFYLMSFYITKSQTEETLQKNKKKSPAVCFSQSLQGTYLIRLKQQLHLIPHFNSRSDKFIRFFPSFVFGFQVLGTASQTCSDQIQHIYIVKTIIDGLAT